MSGYPTSTSVLRVDGLSTRHPCFGALQNNAVSSYSNRPISQYDDNDDDGVLTPSSTYEDQLFDKERKRKTRLDVYEPRVDHSTFKFNVMQRFKDATECKGDVRKWAIIHGYNLC